MVALNMRESVSSFESSLYNTPDYNHVGNKKKMAHNISNGNKHLRLKPAIGKSTHQQQTLRRSFWTDEERRQFTNALNARSSRKVVHNTASTTAAGIVRAREGLQEHYARLARNAQPQLMSEQKVDINLAYIEGARVAAAFAAECRSPFVGEMCTPTSVVSQTVWSSKSLGRTSESATAPTSALSAHDPRSELDEHVNFDDFDALLRQVESWDDDDGGADHALFESNKQIGF